MAAWEGTRDEKVCREQREEDGVGEESGGEGRLISGWNWLAHFVSSSSFSTQSTSDGEPLRDSLLHFTLLHSNRDVRLG